MKKLWAIIPAAALAVGAGVTGVLANARSEKNNSFTVDIPKAVQESGQSDTERSSSANSPTASSGVLMAGSAGEVRQTANSYDCPFVDADGDGNCDNYGIAAYCHHEHRANNAECPFVDADGDGNCDNYGIAAYCHHEHRTNNAECPFVDADGDGICDNYGGAYCNHGNGNGYGCSFTDVNGDGICDNYGSAYCDHAVYAAGANGTGGGHHGGGGRHGGGHGCH